MRKLNEADKKAIDSVNQLISDYRTELEAITLCKDDLDPIMIVGETETGYICQLMVDPKDVASIMLEYNYPAWYILGEKAPKQMWAQLGRKFGLDIITEVDL